MKRRNWAEEWDKKQDEYYEERLKMEEELRKSEEKTEKPQNSWLNPSYKDEQTERLSFFDDDERE